MQEQGCICARRFPTARRCGIRPQWSGVGHLGLFARVFLLLDGICHREILEMRGEELLRRLRELVHARGLFAAVGIRRSKHRRHKEQGQKCLFHRSFCLLVRQSLAANIAPDFERNLKYDNLYNRLQKKQCGRRSEAAPETAFQGGGGRRREGPRGIGGQRKCLLARLLLRQAFPLRARPHYFSEWLRKYTSQAS